ncbi:cytochrome P450 [Colletotrichum somersetense]|nr:cytochrome P450 [Colletotrichum somersetense]
MPNAGCGAGYSRLAWAFRQEYCGSITLRLPKIHEHLGPLVRIGPKEVSFYSIDIYDLVHKVNSGFVKDPRNYGEFVQDGHPALFSITDPDEHTKRRRILGQLFSRSKIVNLEGLMLHHVNEFVKSVEIISEFSFGEDLHAISGWSNDCDIPIVSKNDQKATFMPLVTHILFALSRNPTYQEKLYQDLAKLGFPTDMGSLENIPRLKACVKEGIRWAGAAAAMLPRVVPQGSVELCGKFIPEGTVITSLPIWYLRDRYAYPNPERFDPYRWIDETGTFMTNNALRDKFYVPFSKGSNMVDNFEIVHVNKDGYGQVAGLNNSGWQPVQLPKRNEWVAAVVTQPSLVKTVPRVRR